MHNSTGQHEDSHGSSGAGESVKPSDLARMRLLAAIVCVLLTALRSSSETYLGLQPGGFVFWKEPP